MKKNGDIAEWQIRLFLMDAWVSRRGYVVLLSKHYCLDLFILGSVSKVHWTAQITWIQFEFKCFSCPNDLFNED